MGTIYIESHAATFPAGLVYEHLYLVYKDDFGVEFVIRGGPSWPDNLSIELELGLLADSKDNRDGGDPVVDFGQREIMTGTAADNAWQIMLQQANLIDIANLAYTGLTQNSNSVVAAVLHAVGIDLISVLPGRVTGLGGGSGDALAGDNKLLESFSRQLHGGSGDDVIHGGDLADILTGDTGGDTLSGGSGVDLIQSGSGDDFLFGDDGNDILDGGFDNDLLYGGGDADTLYGNVGNDYLEGGADNDTLNGGTGFDRLNGGTGIDTYQIDTDFGNVIISGDTDGGTISLLSGVTFRKAGAGAANTNGLYVAKDENGEWLAGKEAWSVSVSGSTATVTIPDADKKAHTIVIENFDINSTNKKYGITFAESVAQASAEQANVYALADGQDWNQQQRDNPTADPFEARSITYNAADYLYHYGVVMDGDTIAGPATGFEAVTYFFDGNSQADVLHGNDWKSTQQSLFNAEDPNVHLMFSSAADITNPAGWFGDVLQGYDGDDTITGDGRTSDANDYNTVGDNDILVGGKGNDVIYGGAGNDTLYAWQDLTHYSAYLHINDYTGLQYDAGEYASVQEALYGGAVTLEEEGEQNYLDGGAGDDVIAGASYDDTIDGGSGIDYIMAGAGRDVIAGGTGNDIIYSDSFYVETSSGSITRDFIAPDVMPGEVSGQGFYSRAYFYRDGVDMDTLFDPDEDYNDLIDGGDGADTIFGEIGHDNIAGGANNDVLFGDRPFSAGYFDGIASGFQKLSSRYHGDDVIDGGTGNDKIIGGGGSDYLLGGQGHDTLYGDVGVKIFDRKADSVVPGDEADAIKASDDGWWGKDFLVGGEGDDILVGEGNDDTLDGGDGNDKLYGDWTPDQPDAFSDPAARTGNYTLYGGAGNDQLMGNSGDDTLEGGAGDDNMFGDSFKNGEGYSGNGDDVINGGAGNDKLYGGNGTDTLDGGSGNDELLGGDGNDIYMFGAGNGVDLIDDTSGSNKLYLSSQPVKTLLQGDNAVIYLSDDGSNRIQMSASSFAAIETVYVNGEAIDLEITVPDNNYGNSLIQGTSGNDTYVIGDQYAGQYFLLDQAGDNSIEVNDVWLENGRLHVDGGGNYDLLNNNNPAVKFIVSSQSWDSLTEIRQSSGNVVDLHIEGDGGLNVIRGLNGNDLIQGFSGADTLFGGAGNDTLDAGAGNDTLYGESGNDTFFVSGRDEAFGGEGNDNFQVNDDFYGYVTGGEGADTFHVVADNAAIGAYAIKDEVFEAGDVIQLDVNSDSVHVNADHIMILTPDKTDVSHVGVSYLQDIPKEAFWERMEGLSIRFADGEIWDTAAIKLHTSTGTSLGDAMIGDASANTLDGMNGNDQIYGAGGNDTLYGGADNDYLAGGAGDDVLVGGTGSDDLAGGAGNDVFHFGIGSDSDLIVENDLARGADADVIYLENGIDVNDVILKVSDIDDLTLELKSSGDSIAVLDFFNASETRERNLSISFDGVTQWDTARIHQEVFKGTSGNNIYGMATSGSDTITGNNGNNWIDGGEGDDMLTGGSGADVFRFGVDTDHDTVTDATGSDTVRLDFTVGIGDLTLELLANNQLKIGRHNASGVVTDSVQVNKVLGNLVDVSGNQLMVEESTSLLALASQQMVDRTFTLLCNPTEPRGAVFSASDVLGSDLTAAEKSRWNITGATHVDGSFLEMNLDEDEDLEQAFLFIEDAWGSGINYVAFVPPTSTGSASIQLTLQRDDGLTLVTTMAVNFQNNVNSLTGGDGNDLLDGAESDTALVINGDDGNDVIRDGFGDDVVSGGDGNDLLTFGWGGNGNDTFFGDAGNDTLDAGWGTDTMVGGTGNDLYIEGGLWSGDHTTIDNSTADSGDVDTLEIGQGYGMWDFRSLWFTQDGTDLLINQLDEYEDGEIRIKNWYVDTDTETEGFQNGEGAGRLDVIRVNEESGNVYQLNDAGSIDLLVQAMAEFATPPASVAVAAESSNLNNAYDNAWTLAVPAA